MSENYRPSSLKFSLDEVVSFRRGEEISELINLSLEPNVTLQELDHYISIRGTLDMFGEYKKTDGVIEDDDSFSFSGQKFVQVSETREEGVCEFQYDFPVDITIPKTRVQDVEELSIAIDSFDYTIPDSASLRLTTDLSITGVYEEVDEETRVEEDSLDEDLIANEVLYQSPETELTPFQMFEEKEETESGFTFSAEARKTEEEEETEEETNHVPIHIFNEQNEHVEQWRYQAEEESSEEENKEYQFFDSEEPSRGEEEIINEELKDTVLLSYDESPDSNAHDFQFGTLSDEDDQGEESSSSEESSSDEESVEIVESEDNEYYRENIEQEDYREQVEEEVSDFIDLEEVRNEKSINYQPQASDETDADAISLTNFFARKEEEPRAAKMKIYIVQEEDTLNSIAEKYEVNVSQILRMNRMEAQQDVYEGQLLTIPVKAKTT